LKSRKLALILSFFYCGLGQIYKGQILKGVNFVIIYTALIAFAFFPMRLTQIIGISALPLMWIVGMVDAYMVEAVFIDRRRFLLAILPGIVLSGIVLYIQIAPSSERVIYVSINTGDNNNPGTKAAPMKNIDKAILAVKSGGVLLVAEGTYSGTLQIGYIATNKPVQLYGGYSKDFSERDVVNHPTLFQPSGKIGDQPNRAFLKLSDKVDGTVVDGFIFDMSMRNVYSPDAGKPRGVETGMLLLPPPEAEGDRATIIGQCIYIAAGNTGGNITISNNVFLNGAQFAIHGAIPTGLISINNNIFVSNRMASIEVWGSGIGKMPAAEIAYNTILFSWGRTDSSRNMGYGIRMVDKMRYNIHHNIIGASTMAGVYSNNPANDKWAKLDDNIFFLNRKTDLEYSRRSGALLQFPVSEFGNLEFSSSSGNSTEITSGYPIDKAYLEGFLNSQYARKEDLRPGSYASMMRKLFGLRNPGSTPVTMFCNRYPWEKALEFFGAVNGVGAQTDKWPLIKPQPSRNILPGF